MSERTVEVRFCIVINNLLRATRYSIVIVDFIEMVSLLSNCNITTIKKLMRQVKDGAGYICPTREELCYTLKELGYSYREIARLTGIATSTQQRFYKTIEANPNTTISTMPRLNAIEYEEVYKFMKAIDLLKGTLV